MYIRKNIYNILLWVTTLSIFIYTTSSIADTNTANTTPIRIAVLEILMSQKFSSAADAEQYLKGVSVAEDYCKVNHIPIDHKEFFYDESSLSIVKKIHDIQAWKPDVIIGPRLSDGFLLLQYYFKNILVLSPLATSDAITDMPNNFYSLALPDSSIAKITYLFYIKHYKNKRVFLLNEADCKSCTEISENFKKVYENMNPGSELIKISYIQDNVTTLNMPELLKNYKPGDIFIMPSTSYSAGILIQKIVNYLNTPNLVFIGGDLWGNWEVDHVSLIKTKQPFNAYRISPQFIDKNSSDYKIFFDLYEKRYGETSSIVATTYQSYLTIISAIQAYQKNSDNFKNTDTKTKILQSYQKELEINKNWLRPNTFIFYKVKNNGEYLADKITLPP